jgi:hypothetical protein
VRWAWGWASQPCVSPSHSARTLAARTVWLERTAVICKDERAAHTVSEPAMPECDAVLESPRRRPTDGLRLAGRGPLRRPLRQGRCAAPRTPSHKTNRPEPPHTNPTVSQSLPSQPPRTRQCPLHREPQTPNSIPAQLSTANSTSRPLHRSALAVRVAFEVRDSLLTLTHPQP